ncbi:MAG: carboxylesterase family protein [Proteobacteria bacterium]|nr:carboxylesterase family protein [Pseudomonadota bacterium]
MQWSVFMGVIVETAKGKVEGVQTTGYQYFLGVPFAAPPVGDLRFRAPQPVSAWSGVRDAGRVGLSSMQDVSTWPGMEVGDQGEDCLYLNVHTPKSDGGRRPVMFWIHGGGFTYGSGTQTMFKGGRLAARGDVVVVTFNYRLGAFGFLNLPGAEANAGLLDQIAALQWVHENVAAFGGDPSNITVFGESAGGISVGMMFAIPSARRLFRRVIAQSGSVYGAFDAESGREYSKELLLEFGIDTKAGAEALRGYSARALLEAQLRVAEKLRAHFVILPFRPAIDGSVVQENPLESVRKGKIGDKQLLVGTNRDELKAFNFENPHASKVGLGELRLTVRSMLKSYGYDETFAEDLIDVYRSEEGLWQASPFDILMAINTDCFFRIPAVRLAEFQQVHQPDTFSYLFTWESPAVDGKLGACHALEIPFAFGTLNESGMSVLAGEGPVVDALSERMMDAWTTFAHNGNPSHPGLPAWDAYEPTRRATMLLGEECGVHEGPLEKTRAVWDGII